MVGVSFVLNTTLNVRAERAFDLSRSVDVHAESMAHSSERAVGGVTHGLMSLGESVTWKAKHFGVPFRMESRITEMTRPVSFTDEQVRGPFRYFRHDHSFTEEDGVTLMVDRVSFAAPFGLIGRFAEVAFLATYMRRLIEVRNRFLASVAESGGTP